MVVDARDHYRRERSASRNLSRPTDAGMTTSEFLPTRALCVTFSGGLRCVGHNIEHFLHRRTWSRRRSAPTKQPQRPLAVSFQPSAPSKPVCQPVCQLIGRTRCNTLVNNRCVKTRRALNAASVGYPSKHRNFCSCSFFCTDCFTSPMLL